jgi:NAD-dependent dihydropyrimidine dehydrogenase PreA subunit
MGKNKIFEELATMIAEEDIVGSPITPALIKLVSIQYTEEEAGLALKIRLAGGTLDELSEKTGVEKDSLLHKMLIMADKGTLVYDPADENPVYRAAGMSAGGLTETGLWAGINFPYTVALGKVLNQVSKEHADEGLAKLGFAFTPVWATRSALPEDAAPEEDLTAAIKDGEHYSVSTCPCRLSRNLLEPDNPCSHMLETCIHTGALSRWSVKHKLARELTYEETLEHLEKCNKDGLVHTINILGQICNCCEDCCAIFRSHKIGAPTFIPSPFMAVVDEDSCTECETCADRCPVAAIKVEGAAEVNVEICIGCGVCYPSCPSESIRLERRPVD